jgi:hypothetical protein
MINVHREHSIDDSYQVSVVAMFANKGDNIKSYLPFFYSLGKSYLSFNRGEFFFRNQPIRNKNCLWRPWLLTDRDEMSIFIEDLP